MLNELHRAEWKLPYPKNCNTENIPRILWPLMHVEHEMEDFPWHLVGRMISLLETPEASFEYLHVTVYFRARAAMLALKGDVLDHKELHTALSKHQVQTGGIYRKHLIRVVRTFLVKNNLVQLPECDFHAIDPTYDPKQAEMNRDLIQRLIHSAEFNYLNTLNFISVAPEMEEEISNHSTGFWVKGAEMPNAEEVWVRVRPHKIGHDITPCLNDVKRITRAGKPVPIITVRHQAEFPFAKAGDRMTDNRGHTQDSEHAKVLGDFNVIILPSGRKMQLTRKYKRRAFLRAAHLWCSKHHTDTFFWQEILEDYNAQFKDPTQRCMQIMSDRIDDDLFKGQKSEFDELFQILDRTAGHLRMKVPILVAKKD